MSIVNIVKGDILNAKEKYIVQQCNCLTITSHGLSKAIATRFPWGNPYKNRRKLTNNCAIIEDRDIPGSIRVLQSSDTNDKVIVCMFAQWGPGKPLTFKSYPNYQIDTYDNRIKWFKECLEKLKDIGAIELAFPWMIGCGLAGGDWTLYKKLIEDFSRETGIKCTFYHLV